MFSWKMHTAVADSSLQTQLVGLNKKGPFAKHKKGNINSYCRNISCRENTPYNGVNFE